jgi:hypothetical protein
LINELEIFITTNFRRLSCALFVIEFDPFYSCNIFLNLFKHKRS